METLLFTLVLVSFCIIVFGLPVLIVLWAYKKADIPLGPDTNWFAKCRPGKVMGVLLGGNLWKWLTNVNGMEIKDKEGTFTYVEGEDENDEDDKVIKLITKEKDPKKVGHLEERFYKALGKSQENTFWKKLGIHWVWFRPVGGVFKKKSEWLEWVVKTGGKNEKPDSKETLSQNVEKQGGDYWDFSFSKQVLMVAMNIEAGMTADTAKEDKTGKDNVADTTKKDKTGGDYVAEKIELDFFAVFTVYLLCPYKAVAILDWIKALKAEWEATCTEYAKTHSVDQTFMKDKLDIEIIEKLFGMNPFLLEKYGFVIGNIQYIGAGFSGDSKALREASNKAWIAEQQAAATMTAAKAERFRAAQEGAGQGEANASEIKGLMKDPEMGRMLLWQRAVSLHNGPLFLGEKSNSGMLVQDTSNQEVERDIMTPPTKKGGKV
ncbi:MAG: hypothetical protein WCC74_00460 [Minisyncoccia bacterium]